VLVLELRTKHRACYGADDAMTTHFVAAEVASCTATQSTHHASVALGLGVGIGWSVPWRTWLAILRVMLLALRILVGWVCALLRELVLWLCTGVASLLLAVVSLLLLLLVLLVIRSYLLSMLESAMSWCTILLVVVRLCATAVVLALWLLWRIARLLITTLVIAALLRWVRALRLRGVLLVVLWRTILLAAVLVVRVGHDDLFVLLKVGKCGFNVPGQKV